MNILLQSAICAVAIFSAPLINGEEKKNPPAIFLEDFGVLARAIWISYHSGDTFDVDAYIRDHAGMGSRHDGDRMWILARHLAVIPEDPHAALSQWIKADDPEKRAFGVVLCGYLGDRRFIKRLQDLKGDESKLNWDIAQTVGECADESLKLIEAGGHVNVRNLKVAPWLEKATK